jgi:hypothetical protein
MRDWVAAPLRHAAAGEGWHLTAQEAWPHAAPVAQQAEVCVVQGPVDRFALHLSTLYCSSANANRFAARSMMCRVLSPL